MGAWVCGKLNGGWREVIIKWNEKLGSACPAWKRKTCPWRRHEQKKKERYMKIQIEITPDEFVQSVEANLRLIEWMRLWDREQKENKRDDKKEKENEEPASDDYWG